MEVDYEAGTQTTRLKLPYLVPDVDNYRLVTRSPFGDKSRGTQLPVHSSSVEDGVTVLQVFGDLEGCALYGGWRVSSERLEGQFFPRDDQGGYAHTERCTVAYYTANHSKSGYYRLEKINPVTRAVDGREEMTGRYNGDPENRFGEPILKTGSTKLPVAALNELCRIRLINDTFLPSAWQSAVWEFSVR